MNEYKEGQVWRYHTRPVEPESTLTICKVESHAQMGTIVHISVENLKVKNARRPQGFSDRLPHTPISTDALDQSVTELVKEDAPLPDYLEGYRTWQEHRGGVFTIPVAECIEFTERAINQ